MSTLLAVLLYLWIGCHMWQTRGFYTPEVWLYAVGFFAGLAALTRTPRRSGDARLAGWALAAMSVVFLGLLLRRPRLLYAVPGTAATLLSAISAIGLAVAILVLVVLLVRRNQDWPAFTVVAALASTLAVLLIVAHALVPLISPRPSIDVFLNNTLAVKFFRFGVNPYSQTYPDIYGGRFDYHPGFLYFPASLFWFAPFQITFHDLRFGLVAAQGFTAAGLWALARRTGVPTLVAWLLPVAWLSFPVTYFVLEQAWTDTLIIALVVWIFYALESRRWLWTAVLIGVILATKQHTVIIVAIALGRIWRTGGRTAAILVAAGSVAVAALIMVPFIVSDPRGFYEMTIVSQMAAGVRADGFGMAAFLSHEAGWRLPGWAQAAITSLAAGIGLLRVARERQSRLQTSAWAMLFGYGCAFLWGKFAFCNYHYLLASFVLVYICGSAGVEPAVAVSAGRRARVLLPGRS